MAIPSSHRSCLLSDTINAAHVCWIRSETIKLYNMVTLAIWRSENFGLWLTPDEERFFEIALSEPPHDESKL